MSAKFRTSNGYPRPTFITPVTADSPQDIEIGAGAVPVLVARDYSRLRSLARLWLHTNDPVGRVLVDKLHGCRVVRPDAVPHSVVILDARIVFAVAGCAAQSRVLVMPELHAAERSTLPVSTPLGAALLGATAGDWVEVVQRDGRRLDVHIAMVQHCSKPRLSAGSESAWGVGLMPCAPAPGANVNEEPPLTILQSEEDNMLARMEEPLRPPLMLSAEDHTRLVALASVVLRRSPLVARLLLDEADRAEVVPTEQLPTNAVALGSLVQFRDETTGETRRLQVVLPGKADIVEGRISVLSLVGAGLIGVSAGHSIDWPAQDGRLRRLTVLRVEGRSAEPSARR
jgi:regulator of nucleoside diphosphate kinase